MNEENNNRKSKGGRPKNAPELKRRHPGWGFTETEISQILKEFEKSSESTIGLFIYKVVTKKPIQVNQASIFPEELKSDFKNLGNNINQIALSLNTKKTEPLANSMLEQLERIARQYQFLVQRLSKQ
jgi:truncated hemoglobin YjbI